MHLQTLAIRRELGDTAGFATSLVNLGAVATRLREWQTSRELFEEALVLCRELQDAYLIAGTLTNLGWIEHTEGNYSKAINLHKEGLSLQWKIGDRSGIAYSLEYIAASISRNGAAELAATAWGAADLIREEIHSTLHPDDWNNHETEIAAAHDAISKHDVDVAWQRGRTLALEKVVDLVLAGEPELLRR